MATTLDPCHDRARGALLGLAAGDAVGTTVEFKSPGSFPPVTDMVGGGPFELAPGQWTDDTSMALCLAESIVDRGGHDPADQMRRYLRWWKKGYFSPTGVCFDIGIATRRQLDRYRRTGEPIDPQVDEEAAANGSLMRLAPVSIRWSHDPHGVVAMAAESSRTTHAARRPVDACKLLAAMTAALIRGDSWEAVTAPTFWNQGPLHGEIEALARGSWRGKQPPAIRGRGYCVAALEAAIWAVAGADDFRTAILSATNLGEDADTTAAIAGQLAGARFGAAAIPPLWLELLAMRPRIESLADALHAAAIGGTPRWQHDDRLHAWPALPGRIIGGEYPRGDAWDDDQEAVDLPLDLLADAGVETILDLTISGERKPYSSRWTDIGQARGRRHRRIHHPIADGGAPHPQDRDAIIADIDAQLAAGRRLYIHCNGGRGRTGVVTGLYLVWQGMTADEALAAIQEARRGSRKENLDCPENETQIEAIRAAQREPSFRSPMERSSTASAVIPP